MRRALVTGATGLVGSHIVERLVQEGVEVRALVRTPHAAATARSLGAEPVTGDVLDAPAVARAARGCDALFHTAAAITPRGGWEAFRELNVDGTRNAIAAAREAGARLLHLSSVAVYGTESRYGDAEGRIDEQFQFEPLPERMFYARSKRDAEALVFEAQRAGRVWATAVRPCVIYGRRDRQFVPRLARVLRHGIVPLIGSGTARFSVVHAANVAQGAVLAARADIANGRVYNLANDSDVSVARFFSLAARGLDQRVRMPHIPEALARGAFRVVTFALRIAGTSRLSILSDDSLGFLTRDNPFVSLRAREELGWSPHVSPEEGVPDAFRWWREHQEPLMRVHERRRGATR
jgi:nucleoside-diphosphate-sugar epimerase